MPKITLIGAGSAVFATQILRDILATPELGGGELALIDIDPERLELTRSMAERLAAASSGDWSVRASTRREELLGDSDYLINMIEVAGLANVRSDYETPLKYGVDQCIGDTSGPGGLFKALRTLPAWIDILHDAEELAPGCLVLNYANPMSISVLCGLRASRLPVAGLCHSVQHTSAQLAVYLELPYPELRFRCAGINHLAWFTELSREGQDLYPLLRQRARLPEVYEQDPVRFELMFELGAFVTESSGHVSEYLPYFRKRADLRERYLRSGYRGESGYYANNWPAWREQSDEQIRQVLNGEEPFPLSRGIEYAADIIQAVETDRPAVVYANVLNAGCIDNLPASGVVEVACLVDANGVQPARFGALPEHLAALIRPHMAFHELVVQAMLERDREKALRALMLDPLTAAACSLAEIRAMFDEMVAAQRAYLPDFLK